MNPSKYIFGFSNVIQTVFSSAENFESFKLKEVEIQILNWL